VVHAGGAETIIDAVQRHQRTAAVCEAGCAAIAALVLRFPAHCDAVIAAGGPELICTTLELHANSAAVQVRNRCVTCGTSAEKVMVFLFFAFKSLWNMGCREWSDSQIIVLVMFC